MEQHALKVVNNCLKGLSFTLTRSKIFSLPFSSILSYNPLVFSLPHTFSPMKLSLLFLLQLIKLKRNLGPLMKYPAIEKLVSTL